MTWATSVPILVFLGLCSRPRPDVRNRQTSDRRQTKASLNATALWGRRHNNRLTLFFKNKLCAWRHNIPARCTPDAAAQLQPIPYACGAQRTLLPVAVGAMNIHDVRDRRQTDDRRRQMRINA